MAAANYLTQSINGLARLGFVVYPTLRAAQHVTELARRTLNAGLGVIGIQLQMPVALKKNYTDKDWNDASFQTKVYTKVHAYLPNSITAQNDAFKDLSEKDLIKAAAFYTVVSIVSIFVLNKLIGPMPEIYNQISRYTGSALRFDPQYDVIQMAFDYVAKR